MIRATARLQFHEGFSLDDAVAQVPYLAALGASHVYASPLLMSRPGSTHGYDIVDHNRIDPELGGFEALLRLVDALRAHTMGLILDIVPNHMGVGGSDNAWWLDVLEWGRASVFATTFDIDWDPPDASLRGKMLMPFLGAPYGDALASGDLKLTFDAEDGRFSVRYHEHKFPISPRDYAGLLSHTGFPARPTRQTFADAREMLRGTNQDAVLAGFSPDTADGRAKLHRLLERQNYRLSWWRAATDEINWRRFFDVNALAGVRAELPDVFDATHDFILKLYADGLIDGVRIDHVDGLADPRGYCRKLRRKLHTAREQRPEHLRDEPVIWIEKILAPDEPLDPDWLTDGTTGYDFMDQVSAVLHDPAGCAPLTKLWTALTGRPEKFETEAAEARREILRVSLASELNATAAALHRLARRDLRTRDYTLTAIRRALTEILVHFPVYRIYAGVTGIGARDRAVLDQALAGARETLRSADVPLLDLLDRLLSGNGLRDAPAGPRRREWLAAMIRFQQLSAPTAAKSVEDTSFYRYGRLLSRNEVGSDPAQWSITPDAFHNANRARRKNFPRGLLATATHDHKRGEDFRARLAVLSEIPGEWDAALTGWLRDWLPEQPDAADAILILQTLVGAWPPGLLPTDAAGVKDFGDRVRAWTEKALREAKRHTGWVAPDEAYEAAAAAFVFRATEPDAAAAIAAFAARLAPAGIVNALSQTVLRCTSPGVPDLYQGTEFWDFSLVDPDNRRPVDYGTRAEALGEVARAADLLENWADGRIKQHVIARLLGHRARQTTLYAEGTYTPLTVEGPLADHVLAFARAAGPATAIVIVARLPASLLGDVGTPVIPVAVWRGTSVDVQRFSSTAGAHDILTGATIDLSQPRLDIGTVLATLPVAVVSST